MSPARPSSIRPSRSSNQPRRRRRSCSIPRTADGSIPAPSCRPRVSISRCCGAPRTVFVDELVLGVVGSGDSADAGPLSRAATSTSTASPTSSIRACSRGACRRSPTRARCGSPAGSARSREWSGDAQEIYDRRLPVDDALRRIETLYKPYHRALRRLVTTVHRDFGAAILVDCHSMPSTAGAKRRTAARRCRARRPLRHELRRRGRRYGRATLRDLRLPVSRNKPYAGGFITEHYGNPAAGLHAHPARDQPRPLHGRAPLRAAARASTAWPPT